MSQKQIDSINWEIPDYSRERPRRMWDSGRKLLKSIRDYQKIDTNANLFINIHKKICVISHRFWSIVTGAEIDLNCQIGGDLLIPHPNSIVIHPETLIGNNCTIFQQFTLDGSVGLGTHVDIGAGAKILGPLVVGDHARIGANAVVVNDVPSNKTVVGFPEKESKE